jgi:nucleoside-diphosphate-sugar epimerase
VLNRIALTFFLITSTVSLATIASGQTTEATAVATEPALSESILIFGATRGTGLELAKLLTARGDAVTAFVRPTSDRSGLEPLGVKFIVGDALVADEVKVAFAEGRYRAVVTTLGCFRCEVPPDYLGNKNVFDAAKSAGVNRVMMISSVGAGDSADAPPWISKWILKDVVALKTQAEDHLRSSGVAYTIIRPGGLKDAEATGNGLLTEDVMAMGIITRKDLAQLMLQALDDEAAANKIYTAKDSEMSWPWDMWN